jgi:hypothetical protein
VISLKQIDYVGFMRMVALANSDSARDGDVPSIERIHELLRFQTVRSMFRCLDAIRRTYDLDIEEALLYLGIGYLNTEKIHQMGSRGYIAATNIASAAEFALIPKETARRKIARLAAAGLVTNKGGVVVTDITGWFQFATQLMPSDR